ncbi:MAG: nucleoside deaminase [Candidatus Dependentiae bacterium]|jgi:tRNA(adenine34) deaminase
MKTHMNDALRQARISLKNNEVPVGAVIVSEAGEVIGRGYNRVEKDGTQLHHAEMRALKRAVAKRGGWRLDGCTIYVTLEPCAMCLGALLLSRVKQIIFGAPSPQFGVTDLFGKLPEIYRSHTIIRGGLQQEECAAMLKRFFSNVRANKIVKKGTS